MNTLKIDNKWSVEYDTDDLDRPYTALRYGMANHGNQPSEWGDCEHAMFYALLEARQVSNETAEVDRPLRARLMSVLRETDALVYAAAPVHEVEK